MQQNKTRIPQGEEMRRQAGLSRQAAHANPRATAAAPVLPRYDGGKSCTNKYV